MDKENRPELPHSASAEASLLAIFLNDKSGESVGESLRLGLRPKMFYDARLRLVAGAIFELYAKGKEITMQGVVGALKGHDALAKAGGEELLLSLEGRKEIDVHLAHYVEIVKEKAFRRRLIKTATSAVEANCPKDASVPEIIETLSRQFLRGIPPEAMKEAHECRELVYGTVRGLFETARERGFNARGTLRILTRLVNRMTKNAGL